MESRLYAASELGTIDADTALKDAYAFLRVPPSLTGASVELPSLMSESEYQEAAIEMSKKHTGRMLLEASRGGGGISQSGFVVASASSALPSKEELIQFKQSRKDGTATTPFSSSPRRTTPFRRRKHVPAAELFGLRLLRDAVMVATAGPEGGGDTPITEGDGEVEGEGGQTEEERRMEGGGVSSAKGKDGTAATSNPITPDPHYLHPRRGLLEKRLALQTTAPKSALDAVFLHADLRAMPSLASLANEGLYVRALDALSERDLSIKRTKAADEEAIARVCTFKPAIGEFAQQVRGPQSVDEFYPKGKAWQEKVASKLAKKKEKEEMERAEEYAIQHAPWKMNPESVAILKDARTALESAEVAGSLKPGTVAGLDLLKKQRPLSSNTRSPADLMSQVRGGSPSRRRHDHDQPAHRDFHAIPMSTKYFMDRTGGIRVPFLDRVEEDIEEREERRVERAIEEEERRRGSLAVYEAMREMTVILPQEDIDESVRVLHTGRCTDPDLQKKRRRDSLKLLRRQKAEREEADAKRADEVAASNSTFERLVAEDPRKYRHLGTTLRGPSSIVPRIGTPAPRQELPKNKRYLEESPAFVKSIVEADKELIFTPQCDHAFYAGSEMELYNKRLAYERALSLRKKKKREAKMEASGYVRLDGDKWVNPTRTLGPTEQSHIASRLQLSARRHRTPLPRTRGAAAGVASFAEGENVEEGDVIHSRKVSKWETICQERIDREMGECTFSPHVSAGSKRLMQERLVGGGGGGDDDQELLRRERKKLARIERLTAARAGTPQRAAAAVITTPSQQRIQTPLAYCAARPRAGSATRRGATTPLSTAATEASYQRRWQSPATMARRRDIESTERQAREAADDHALMSQRRELMRRHLQTNGNIPVYEEDRDRYRSEAEAAISGAKGGPPFPSSPILPTANIDRSLMLTGEPFLRRINPSNYTTATSTSLALYRSAAYGEPLSPEAFNRDEGTAPSTTQTHKRTEETSLSPRRLEMRVRGSKEAIAALRAELSGAITNNNAQATRTNQSTIRVPRTSSSTGYQRSSASSLPSSTSNRNFTSAEYDAMSIDEFLVTILSDGAPVDHRPAAAPKLHQLPSAPVLHANDARGSHSLVSTHSSEIVNGRTHSGVESTVADLTSWFRHLRGVQSKYMPDGAVFVDMTSGAGQFLEGCLPATVMNALLQGDEDEAPASEDSSSSDVEALDGDILAGFAEDLLGGDYAHPSTKSAPKRTVSAQLAYIALFEAMKYYRPQIPSSSSITGGYNTTSRSMSPLIWKRSPSKATTLAGVGLEGDTVQVGTDDEAPVLATSEVRARIHPWTVVSNKFPTQLTLPLFIALFQFLFNVDL